MTTTPVPGSENEFQVKGGSAFAPSVFMASASFSIHDLKSVRVSDVGFRYVMEP